MTKAERAQPALNHLRKLPLMTFIMLILTRGPYFYIMKWNINSRLLYLLLAVSPWICYLEWGGGNAGFLLVMEWQIIFETKNFVDTFSHPLVLLPMAGQLFIFIAAIHPDRMRFLAITGHIMLSLLIFMIFIAGLLQFNVKIIGSALPFMVCSYLFYASYKKTNWKYTS